MALLVKISGIQIEFNLEGHPRNRNFRFLICTLFTGHLVRRVFSCVTVMSIS